MAEKQPANRGCIGLVILFLLSLLILLYLNPSFLLSRITLHYSQFDQLVEGSQRLSHDGPYGVWPEGDVQGRDGETKSGWVLAMLDGDEVAQIGNLRELVVNEDTITGTIDINYIGSEFEKEKFTKGQRFTVNRLEASETDDELVNRLNDYHIEWKAGSGPSIWWQWAPSILMAGVFVLLIAFVLLQRNKQPAFTSYGKNQAKVYKPGELTLSLDHLAGAGKAVEEARAIVDFIQSPEKFQRLGGQPPVSALIVGPTGGGKTALAEAIANEAGVTLLWHAPTDFVDLFVGVGAARVRDLFQLARKSAPCVVFIDELDSIGAPNPGQENTKVEERVQTSKALMLELDQLKPEDRVFVISATNRIEIIDPAFLRKGRFERMITLEVPTEQNREQILALLLKKVELDSSVNLQKIAAGTPGFYGADLASMVNEAALLASQQGNTVITMADFNASIDRVAEVVRQREKMAADQEATRTASREQPKKRIE